MSRILAQKEGAEKGEKSVEETISIKTKRQDSFVL
jgi:hypothetical protein